MNDLDDQENKKLWKWKSKSASSQEEKKVITSVKTMQPPSKEIEQTQSGRYKWKSKTHVSNLAKTPEKSERAEKPRETKEKGWKKATVSKPPKKRGRKLAIFAAVLIAGAVITGAMKHNIKLPEQTVPTFQASVAQIDARTLNDRK